MNLSTPPHTPTTPDAPRLLLVCGDAIGPRMAGPSIRAWELAQALGRAGVPVTLAAPRIDREGMAASGMVMGTGAVTEMAFDRRADSLRVAAEQADAILVQGMGLAHHPFLGALDKPLIVDIYDPFVLENLPQRAADTPGGRRHHHASDLAALCAQLERGDFFLCASAAQQDFWLGMLTALGRVNPDTYDDDPGLERLIGVLPFGLPADPPVVGAPVLRGVVPGIGREDKVLLWGGGIWNWFDPLSPIRAVAALAAERPDLRLVFMGSASPSLFTPKMAMAERARTLAAELGLLDRSVFFLPGWVPYAERAAYLLEADLGISCHHPHIETRFAYRTRLLDCIWAGLPMLVTGGDVLADLVAGEDLGATVPPDDPAAIAAALRTLLDRPRADYAPAFDRVRPSMTWDAAARPLVDFMRDPRRAPDRPRPGAGADRLRPTGLRELPARAVEILREGGPLQLMEEAVRYLRWLRRPG